MKKFEAPNVYLIVTNMTIDELLGEMKIVDLCKKEEKIEKPLPTIKSNSSWKDFVEFCKQSIERVEGSYISAADVYEAYTKYMKEQAMAAPVSRYIMGKFLKKHLKIRRMQNKAAADYTSMYFDLALKDKKINAKRCSLGDIYKFYKEYFVHDTSDNAKIPLDEIYTLYKQWCKEQNVNPIQYHGFSRGTCRLVKKSHLEFRGKNSKGGDRRWLTGYSYKNPNCCLPKEIESSLI